MSQPGTESSAKEDGRQVRAAGAKADLAQDDWHLRPPDLSLLQEVSLAISSAIEIEKLLEIIARSVLKVTETEIATVFLIGASSEMTEAITIPRDKAFMRTQPRPEGLTRQIIDTGKPVIIPDTSSD
ncbi:MAG: GAF domain-containing protein, partial [Chloroflexi bacterium]|nr:GAF domain-containing protein [Chloroflexota bacterium]